jgi:KDO2-lipid IV(A) lauroyltransferase
MIRVMRLLPSSMALAFGYTLGLFVYYIVPIRKIVTLNNLKKAFPEMNRNEINRIARSAYIHFGQSIIEFMRFNAGSPESFSKYVTFVNEHLLQQTHEMGKGTICISGHFGNWELMAAAIRSRGFPMVALAREQRNRYINDLINTNRMSVGIETVQLGMAIRGVLHALRENKIVALLADQDARSDGIFVDFLDIPSSTATGPAVFALKTGAPLLFGAAVRGKGGRHTVYLSLIDYSDLKGLNDTNVKILTQRHAAKLEQFVKQHPDHWFWMHKRWKTELKVD